jgi:CRISPR-associated protein Csd1
MILQSLNKLYDRLKDDPSYGIAPPGFSPQKISFRIVLNPDGTLFEFQDARTTEQGATPRPVQILMPGGAKPPGAGINPCFLWDNQTYLLGRQPEDKPEGFATKRFEAIRDKHLAIKAEINDPQFDAVCTFLSSWKPEEITLYKILMDVGTGFGIFQIRGQRNAVHESPKVNAWWISRQADQHDDGKIISGQCLITGEIGPIARLHPKIKRVTGAQAAGASIVSFNDNAYESFGKSQSFNAPVGESAAFQYGTALNALLDGPQSSKHRIRIGDTTAVFWTEKPTNVEDCLAAVFSSGSQEAEGQDQTQRERIGRLLGAIRSGGNFKDFDESTTPFHILGLAPNAARIAIRFYHRSTVGDLLIRLHDHQSCLSIVREYEQPKGKRLPDPEFPAIWQILRETSRDADDIPPLLGGALTRAIIQGSQYPEGLFAAIIGRIRADRTVNYLRAATLKAILTRNHHHTITTMLDPQNTDPSYLLGRLFTALEKTQDDALGGVNAGLRDRFYGSASATPAAVFPKLLRTYQHHLSKLNGGAKTLRDKLVQEILSGISAEGFPKQFPLREQGIFAIGYYHQRKDFFTKKDQTSATETQD